MGPIRRGQNNVSKIENEDKPKRPNKIAPRLMSNLETSTPFWSGSYAKTTPGLLSRYAKTFTVRQVVNLITSAINSLSQLINPRPLILAVLLANAPLSVKF